MHDGELDPAADRAAAVVADLGPGDLPRKD